MNPYYGAEVLMTPANAPSSPPITPNSGGPVPRPPRNRAQPGDKRMGGIFGNVEFSPPLDDQDLHHNHLRAATPELLSVPRSRSQQSRASSAFSGSPARLLRRSTPEVESVSEASERHSSRQPSARGDGDELEVEEILDEESSYIGRSRILLPDDVEDAESVRADSQYGRDELEMIRRLEDLHHGDDNKDAANREIQSYRDKKKRWSQASKRNFSESRGSDPDDEDTRTLDFEEVGASARRVKRRKSELKSRTSLIFDDPPPERITEVDEPDDGIHFVDAPPMYEEVDWTVQLQHMPYYNIRDPMAIDDERNDSDSSSVESGSEDLP